VREGDIIHVCMGVLILVCVNIGVYKINIFKLNVFLSYSGKHIIPQKNQDNHEQIILLSLSYSLI
jgi:hypothetical protein